MKQFCIISGLLWILVFTSCGSETYPPIVDIPTYNYRHGQFVWHELGTSDIESSRSFYGELFNWEFEDINTSDGQYVLIKRGTTYIGGMIATSANQNLWVGAVSVEDTEKSVDLLNTLGASTLIGSTRVTGRGTMALVKDPQGALVSLIHSSIGDPPLTEVATNDWLWMELWSDAPDASAEFYGTTLGYDIQEQDANGKPYWIFGKDELKVAGISPNPVSNMKTQWVPYIRVSDPALIAERSEELGGTVLMNPNESIRNGSVAVLTDPNGAIFCVQKWPFN